MLNFFLETEDSVIIDNNIHDYSSNNNANNEGRNMNEYKKGYFVREIKCACMVLSFKYLLLTLHSRKTSHNIKL